MNLNKQNKTLSTVTNFLRGEGTDKDHIDFTSVAVSRFAGLLFLGFIQCFSIIKGLRFGFRTTMVICPMVNTLFETPLCVIPSLKSRRRLITKPFGDENIQKNFFFFLMDGIPSNYLGRYNLPCSHYPMTICFDLKF